MNRSENNQYELEPGWNTGIYADQEPQRGHPRGWQYLAAGMAFILIVSLIAATGDRKKELSMIQHTGGTNDQRAKTAMAIPGSIDPGFYRLDDRILQNGDRRVQPAGDSEGAAGHKKHGRKTIQLKSDAGF